MQSRFEYKTIKLDISGFFSPKVKAEKVDEELNQLGSVGWELVSAFDTNWGHGASAELVLIFKRERG